MPITTYPLTGELHGAALGPAKGADVGVLVLAGSSGRVDAERTLQLAKRGALGLALCWFGGPGQPPGICEIPLETFTRAVDWLSGQGVTRIGAVGVSKGAEAALLLACHDARVEVVVALSPSSVVWANVGPGLDGQTYPYRSSWTWRGQPLPFVPYDDSEPTNVSRGPVAYRPVYDRSLRAFPEQARVAAIPIEQSQARVVLVAGEDDQMWPSAVFARELVQRAASAGKSIEVISHLLAGHRPFFPGEPAPAPSTRYLYGGTLEADAALGAVAWPRALDALGIHP